MIGDSRNQCSGPLAAPAQPYQNQPMPTPSRYGQWSNGALPRAALTIAQPPVKSPAYMAPTQIRLRIGASGADREVGSHACQARSAGCATP